jgi:hypothetical protein
VQRPCPQEQDDSDPRPSDAADAAGQAAGAYRDPLTPVMPLLDLAAARPPPMLSSVGVIERARDSIRLCSEPGMTGGTIPAHAT